MTTNKSNINRTLAREIFPTCIPVSENIMNIYLNIPCTVPYQDILSKLNPTQRKWRASPKINI